MMLKVKSDNATNGRDKCDQYTRICGHTFTVTSLDGVERRRETTSNLSPVVITQKQEVSARG